MTTASALSALLPAPSAILTWSGNWVDASGACHAIGVIIKALAVDDYGFGLACLAAGPLSHFNLEW